MTASALRRAAAVAVAAACSVVAMAGAAGAHVELDRSEPAAGAVVDAAPAEVFLRFTEAVEDGSFTIRVLDPDGNAVTAGETQSGGRAAAVNLAVLTEDGVYRVRYRGVAADGHPVEGRLRFRLRLAAIQPTPTPEPSAPPTASEAPSSEPPVTEASTLPPDVAPLPRQRTTVPWWPFALLLGIAALVGVMLFRRR